MRAPGHERKFILTRQLTFKGQLCSETCRMTYGINSAEVAFGALGLTVPQCRQWFGFWT
jgi:hypothetical protein